MSVIRINLLKRLPIILMVMLLALAIVPAMVSAQETPTEDPGDVVDDGDVVDENLEQKTANLMDAIDSELAALEADRNDKQEALDALSPEDDGYAEAQQALEDAEEALNDRLGDLAGVDADTIGGMRDDGLGYGQICHALGIHPSALGNKYGHVNAHRNKHGFREKGAMSAATARDTRTGWARGHGKSVSGKSNGKGKAASLGIDTNGSAKGKSNGKGGGKGGGNGGGKGGGKNK